MKKIFMAVYVLCVLSYAASAAGSENAKYTSEMRDYGGNLINRYVLEIKGGKAVTTDYAVAGSRDAGTSTTMWGPYADGKAELCCGTPGTLGGDPASKWLIEVSPDGNTATRKFYFPNGNLAETINYRRSS